MHRLTRFASITLLAGAACTAADDVDEVAQELADSSEIDLSVAELTAEMFDGVDAGARRAPDQIRDYIHDRVPERMVDSRCVVRRRVDTRRVELDFNDCDGRRDLRRLRGTLRIDVEDALDRPELVRLRLDGVVEIGDERIDFA